MAELRERAWQRLTAAVPAAINVLPKRKAKLEAQIASGKKLSPRDQRKLEKIRGTLREMAIPTGRVR